MKIIPSILLCLACSFVCMAQEDIQSEAKEHLKEMDDVVKFTKEQKQSALAIFEKFVGDKKELKKEDFASDKELYKEKLSKYSLAKQEIYALCTKEQLEAYNAYKKEQQLKNIAALDKQRQTLTKQ